VRLSAKSSAISSSPTAPCQSRVLDVRTRCCNLDAVKIVKNNSTHLLSVQRAPVRTHSGVMRDIERSLTRSSASLTHQITQPQCNTL